MRTLAAALTTAQKAASTEPHVPVIVSNIVDAVRRHDYTVLDSTANAAGKNGAALPDDGSLTRIRMTGGTVKQQRVTNPAVGPWNVWNDLVVGMGSHVACAAKGARVIIVYTDAAGTGVRYKESTDNGATYGADTLLLTAVAAVSDVSVAYKNSTGDLLIGWVTATNLYVNKRTGGAFGGSVTWPYTVSATYALSLCYALDYEIALTGVEAVSLRNTLWTFIYGDGINAAVGAWTPLNIQHQADPNVVQYLAPSLFYTDTYRLNFTAAPFYAGSGTRTFRSWLHPSLPFTQGRYSFRSAVPLNHASVNGLHIAANATVTGGFVYESATDLVQRSPRDAVNETLTTDVLRVELHEERFRTRGHIDINNDIGTYAGPDAPLQIGNKVSLSFGYNTSGGLDASKVQDLWIAAIEHRRAGSRSVLRIILEGGWEHLARSRQRSQIVHTGAAGDHYRNLAADILSRAGIVTTASGSSARSGTILPLFTVHPQTSGLAAMRELLQYVTDRVIMRDEEAFWTDPLTSDATDYDMATHPLFELALRQEAPPVTDARTFGNAVIGEDADQLHGPHGLGDVTELRDFTSSAAPAIGNTAIAHRRSRDLDGPAGELICPPICGLEILDVIEFSDSYVNPAAIKRRVQEIHWTFDKGRAAYEQRVLLGVL